MNGMSRRQAEFFTVLIIICTLTAAAILFIDFQIKGAILEESNRLRLAIEGYSGGPKRKRTARHGSDHYPSDDVAYRASLVSRRDARMEEESDFVPLYLANGTPQERESFSHRSHGHSSLPNRSE